jgi:hypothetical protein
VSSGDTKFGVAPVQSEHSKSIGLNFDDDSARPKFGLGSLVEGLMSPTRRRVYACRGDYELVPEPLLVAVDITRIMLS